MNNQITTKIVNLSRHWMVLWKRYPLCRGMVTYSIVWPISSICQQFLAGKKTIDWVQVGRFSVFGGFYVAPTLFAWVKLSSAMWPQMTLASGVTKALVEQISYGPFAMCSFFFGMSLLEGKGISEAANEVSNKFVPTYKVGICFWPVMQTINFSLIPEKNRVPFVGGCSLIWTVFLSYMKTLELKEIAVEHTGTRTMEIKQSNLTIQ